MSLKVALWCPNGRDDLALAARHVVQQLPLEFVLWSSNEPSPVEPQEFADIALWLVICGGAPPPPPKWMESHAGVRAIYPGTAKAWTKETETAIGSWRASFVLTDLLPDEDDNRFLHVLYERGSLVWLPAVATAPQLPIDGETFAVMDADELAKRCGLQESCVSKLVTVKKGHCLADATPLSPSTENPLPGRIALLSQDPVVSGALVRFASACGAAVAVLGEPGSIARRVVLGGEVACALGTEAASRLRLGLTSFFRESGCRNPTLPEFSWLDWVDALVHEDDAPRGAGGMAARWLARNQSSSREILQTLPLRARAALGAKCAFVMYPQLTAEAAAISDLARCGIDAAWFHYVGTMVAGSPVWTDAAVKQMQAGQDLEIARMLWYVVCDGFCFRSTRAVREAIVKVIMSTRHETGKLRDSGIILWDIVPVVVLASSGYLAEASVELGRLRRERPLAPVAALEWTLRSWSPVLECGESDMLPMDAAAWWLREATANQANHIAGADIARAHGELWLGCPDRLSFLLDAADGLSVVQLADLAIAAWWRRVPEIGRRVWARVETMAAPEPALYRIPVFVARSLYETPGAEIGTALRSLACEAPQFFEPERPSHSRCSMLALGLHRCGAHREAANWQERAEQQDPLASMRRWSLES